MNSDRNPRTITRLTCSLATVHHRGHWPPGSLSRWISVARSRSREAKALPAAPGAAGISSRASRQEVKFPDSYIRIVLDSYIRIVLKNNCCNVRGI